MDIQNFTEFLRLADRYRQRQQAWQSFWRQSKFIGLLLIALFLVDVVFHLSSFMRTIASIGYILGALAWITALFYAALVKENPAERVARLLESKHPTLGSSLINTLQLHRQIDDHAIAARTRTLAAQAVREYCAKIANIDYVAILRIPHKPQVKRTLLAAAFTLTLLCIFPAITMLEFQRFCDPYGDHPPYSWTQLQIVEPQQKVIYDQAIVIKAKATGHQPGELFLSFYEAKNTTKIHTLPMYNKGSLGFYQTVENIKSPIYVYVHTKNNYSRSAKRYIDVVLTPELVEASLEIRAPAYTGIVPLTQPYRFDNIRALYGSTIIFRLKSNRPLREGKIEVAGKSQSIVPLHKSSTFVVSGQLLARDSAYLRFHLIDVDGIASEKLWKGSLTVTHDLPPQVEIIRPQQDSSWIARDFRLEAQIAVSDDYGIAQVRIHRALNQIFSAPLAFSYENRPMDIDQSILFDIGDLGVFRGDVLSFYVEAIDNSPQANMTTSRTVNLVVISVEEYNEILREQLEIQDIEGKYWQLQEKLRQLLEERRAQQRQIKNLAGELRQDDEQDEEKRKKQKKRLKKKKQKIVEQQTDIDTRLQKLAAQMSNFGRANPVYDIEKDFQKILRQQAEELKQRLQEARQQLDRLSRSDTKQKQLEALEALAEESEKQNESLSQSYEAIQSEIIDTIQDLQKMNNLIRHFNYFKYLYELQTAVAEQVKAYSTVRELSKADKVALRKFASQEKFLAQELEALVADLRKDAKEAEKLYPKAAASARDLANKIEELRLSHLADSAAHVMLIPDGPRGYEIAERLRQEMHKLFKDAQQSNGQQMSGMKQEMDRRLELLRNMNPRRTFSQMSKSRKMSRDKGKNSGGEGEGTSSGTGKANQSGMGMLGNEKLVKRSKRGSSDESANIRTNGLTMDKTDAPAAGNSHHRKAKAVSSQSLIHQYQDVVDAYFQRVLEGDK